MWFEPHPDASPEPSAGWTWIDGFYLALILVQVAVVLIVTFGRTCP